MAISLQDQLKQSGLVDDKKAKQLARAKRKQNKQASNKGKKLQVDQSKLALERAQAEKVARDKQLNQAKTQKAQNKAIAAQVKQLIELNLIPRDGEEKFHFTDAKKIKHIWVSEEQVNHLRKSMIAIVKLEEQYALVPIAVANKISERDTKTVVFIADLSEEETASSGNSEDDDYYANFKIPDDLVW